MKRDVAAQMMDSAFHIAREDILGYVGRGHVRAEGAAQIATLHLVTRSLSDLGWAQNAATARFPIQAYSLMRPAWEALNLCVLFDQKPGLAEEWAAGKFWKLTPSAVRKHIGEDSDHFYSFMSERSHPRFAGMQLVIFKLESDPSQAILHLNDVPIEITPAYMAIATPAIILARLAVEVGRVNFHDSSHKLTMFPQMLRTVATHLAAGWDAIDSGLTSDERHDPEARRPREWAKFYGDALRDLAAKVDAAGQLRGNWPRTGPPAAK